MFSLRVNGVQHQVECESATPLLYVLRNDLGLTAAKFGCGLGLCGSCNVLIDGRPAHSCDTPVWSVADKDITTLEGLGDETQPHPLQTAFIAEQALQCGYCTAGMIVTAAALLERRPDVTDAEVRTELAGNLCRCGVHNRVVRAVLSAAQCCPEMNTGR
ncbi:MAG TPA: (2Fe-2S)-binding protein [Pseudonocardiaceae bacterium]|nr:(2Fe-2S)-binding protein [Pseudonocardiaceae bacterium]